MADKRVTDLTSITTAPTSGVMHFVDITNQTQNAAGSSFKVTKADFLKESTAAILLNTAKVGISTAQSNAITANTAKTGITSGQASAIVTNSAKVGYTEELVSANVSVAANTAKVGISTAQATAISDNTSATATNATAASTNATAILTKLGKSTSTIAVSEVDVLTAAAYAALSTKVATKLYFTT
jgi:hypothetical protein